LKNYFNIILFSLILLNGCASISPSILNPHPNPIPLKLKSLNFGLEGSQVFQFSSIKSATIQTDFATIFSRTLEQNICEGDRVKWGYADLRIVFDDFNFKTSHIPYSILAFGFYPWWIFGGSVLWYERIIQVEIGIYDSKRTLLKKYIIDANSDLTGVGLYDYYSDYNSKRLSGIEVIHKILRTFENKIKNDIEYLNIELTKTGSLK